MKAHEQYFPVVVTLCSIIIILEEDFMKVSRFRAWILLGHSTQASITEESKEYLRNSNSRSCM